MLTLLSALDDYFIQQLHIRASAVQSFTLPQNWLREGVCCGTQQDPRSHLAQGLVLAPRKLELVHGVVGKSEAQVRLLLKQRDILHELCVVWRVGHRLRAL